MTTRIVELGPKEVEANVEVLSSAAQALQLTLFEWLSYRALMVSVYAATASFVAIWFANFFSDDVAGAVLIAFVVCVGVGIILLVLNIPLFFKALRERARLKKLGLSSLSESLWRASRHTRWKSAVRGALITMIGAGFLFATLLSALIALFTDSFLRFFSFSPRCSARPSRFFS
jgi:hypothetical protein